MSKVCITIPVYKDQISLEEKASLLQCCRILGHYVIYLICPASLDISSYTKLMEKMGVEHKSLRFSDSYFEDIHGYNKLLLSKVFYQQIKYDFFLIYQLDAWVFRDELIYWCEQGYDYIGAPWVKDYTNSGKYDGFIGVGNGGLSLRRTKAIIRVLNSFALTQSIKQTFEEVKNRKTKIKKLRGYLKSFYLIIFHHNTFFLLNRYKFNEDYFWGEIAGRAFKWFKVAPISDALSFSFEMYPIESYVLNNNKLPFGCHAWEKYQKGFWKTYIKLDD